MRKQFTFYRSYWETIQKLPTNKEKLQAFEILADYALNENEPDLSDKKATVTAIFLSVKPQLERAHSRSKAILTHDNMVSIPEPYLPY